MDAPTGTRLAQATFTGETASGWQTVTFASPVQVTPNTTYVASYFAPNGHYAATADYFYRAPAPGPERRRDRRQRRRCTRCATPARTTNGVYTYSASSTFPANPSAPPTTGSTSIFTPTPAPGHGDERDAPSPAARRRPT